MAFLALVAALSAPLLIATERLTWQPLPGVPASAIVLVFCPAIAALTLSYAEGGKPAARRLLARSVDIHRLQPWPWLAIILLIHPVLLLAQYAIQMAYVSPLPPLRVELFSLFVLFVIFLIPAWGEETGWTGYVTDPLQRSLGPIVAALTLGIVLAVWHVGPLLAVGRDLSWIAWWAGGTIVARVVFLWIYVRAGRSVAAAVLFHAVSNVAWQTFPIAGSHYDPTIGFLLIGVLAIPAGADLARRQFNEPSA